MQIGGPDVLSYGEMLDRMALAMGMRPRPKLPVPFITPWLSALWLGLVTPVDTNVARPLVEGLTTETIVTDPSGAEPFGDRHAVVRRRPPNARARRRAMTRALVLFTRDLRVRDQPALTAAVARDRCRSCPRSCSTASCSPAAAARPTALAFLLDSLRDLDSSLRERGARLVVRRRRRRRTRRCGSRTSMGPATRST